MSLPINNIYNDDCVRFLKDEVAAETFDCCIADPPFAINFNSKTEKLYNRRKDLVLSGYSEVPIKNYQTFTDDWVAEVYRTLKQTGVFYLVTGWNNSNVVLTSLRKNNFTVLNNIVWEYNFGPFCKRKFVNSHYLIFFAVKNSKKYLFYPKIPEGKPARKEKYKEMSSVWSIKREFWWHSLKTSTNLPYKLVSKMIDFGTKEDDLILDIFSGSGQTSFTSNSMKRNYLGIEINPQYAWLGNQRLKQGKYLIGLNGPISHHKDLSSKYLDCPPMLLPK